MIKKKGKSHVIHFNTKTAKDCSNLPFIKKLNPESMEIFNKFTGFKKKPRILGNFNTVPK